MGLGPSDPCLKKHPEAKATWKKRKAAAVILRNEQVFIEERAW
jgi:hypothetical protein